MNRQVIRNITILVGLLALAMLLPSLGTAAARHDSRAQALDDDTLINQLEQATAGELRLSRHRETGAVRFIGGSSDRALAPAAETDLSPQAAARSFLSTYGKLFGVTDADRDLVVKTERTLTDGRSFVRFQQVHNGVPVVGGELIVQTGAERQVISANGEILSDLDLVDTTPAIDAEAARQTALAKVAKEHNLAPADLTATEPELWIHNPAIMGGPGVQMSRLVWRMDVTPVNPLPIDEFVLVDAQLGNVSVNFNQIHTAKDRDTYIANGFGAGNLPGTLARSEGQGPTGNTDVDLAHDYAGDTYDFYFNEHGRDSIDGAGMTIISTVDYCPSAGNCPYANAFWNGAQMVYGDGFPAADDVVGHELAHGVTDFSSELFYYYQSGAINESLSDVWGEFVDQTNGSGTDNASVKWQMGEDVPGFGAIRDMQDPTQFGDPDRIGSPNYYCTQSDLYSGSGDNGGVHINSGVNNKAAYLMTDGDTFNGYNVTGLGIAKVADLYYEVQTNLLFSAADYADLYDALIQASINLGFNAAEQQAVRNALDAVEMSQPPTICPAPEAPICSTVGMPNNLFFDDLESGGGQWVDGSIQGASAWFAPHSTETLGLPGPYATSGVDNIWGFDQGSPIGSTSDTYLAMQNSVAVPSGAYLHFNHSFGFESGGGGAPAYDGGVLEYSTNGGSSWQDANALFTHNGYNGTISSSFGNPLGGRDGFVADSRGYISSRLNLNSLSGQNVQFRFRIGTDSSIYDYGWFIDDVRIYTCAAPAERRYLPVILKQ